MIVFEYPTLIGLVLLPFLVRLLFPSIKESFGRAMKVPFLSDLKKIQESAGESSEIRKNFASKKFLGLFVIWLCMTLAMMKPVLLSKPIPTQNKGHDILLVTDISTSMLEDDFRYQGYALTRLDAVRAVVSDFVKKRKADRMGLILFGTRAYLQVPLTFDKKALLDVLSTMKAGMAGQSTAIGDAVGLSVKALSADANIQNRAVILLTDGENNDGSISLPKALKLAQDEGIKIYTIGIGSEKLNLADAIFGVSSSGLDEKSLKELALKTKGQYFKATSLADLVQVYNKIDALEGKDIESGYMYPQKDLYIYPLILALTFLVFTLFSKFFQLTRRKL